jgi:hypothetical protein
MIITSLLPDSYLTGYDGQFRPMDTLQKFSSGLIPLDFASVEDKAKGITFRVDQLINKYCSQLNINQRLLLVTLQREMGLITNKTPTADQLKRACGCGCFDDGVDDTGFYGFEKQIACAALTYRNRFNEFVAGQSVEIIDDNCKSVIPGSAITRALLVYTPHVSVIPFNEAVWIELFGKI